MEINKVECLPEMVYFIFQFHMAFLLLSIQLNVLALDFPFVLDYCCHRNVIIGIETIYKQGQTLC